MIRVLGIARTSTSRQEIEAQRLELLDYIKSDGYTDDEIEIIVGEGASAIKMDDLYQQNMDKVKEYIERGGIECIYAWALDRIGRNDEFLTAFKNYLIKHQVNLKIKNPNLYLLEDDGSVNNGMEIAFTLFSTMAKQEMEQKKARFKRAREHNASVGKYGGGKYIKYGYTVDEKGYLVEDGEKGENVRKFFAMYATGDYTLTSLKKELNELGYSEIISTVWLSRLFNFRGYIGESVGEKIKIKYPRIVSDERFNEVQKILKANNTSADKQHKHHYFGNKIVRCNKCGAAMSGSELYMCQKCFHGDRIAVDFMDGLLFQVAANEHLLFLARNSALESERLKNDIDINLKKKIALEAQNDALIEKINRAKTLYKKGLSSEKELDEDIARIRLEDNERKNRILELDEKIKSLESQIELLEQGADYEKILEAWDTVLNEEDEKEKAKIVKAYIKKAVVTKSGNYRLIDIELVSGKVMNFKYRPHVKYGRRLVLIDGENEKPYVEYYVKRKN